jgi:hypothetical protein
VRGTERRYNASLLTPGTRLMLPVGVKAVPAHARPWNPDWVSHRVAEVAAGAGVELDIKGGRHYTASQLLAGGFDLRNTAARHPEPGRPRQHHRRQPPPRP